EIILLAWRLSSLVVAVHRTRSVAVFAADRLFVQLQAMDGAADFLDAAGVADEARGADRTLEARMLRRIVARRNVPLLPRGIPGDRRFVQEAVHLDRITAGEIPGADEITDWHVHAGDFFPALAAKNLFMSKLIALPIGAIGPPRRLMLERSIG